MYNINTYRRHIGAVPSIGYDGNFHRSGQDLTERSYCFAVHFLQPHSHGLATWHCVIWLEKYDPIKED